MGYTGIHIYIYWVYNPPAIPVCSGLQSENYSHHFNQRITAIFGIDGNMKYMGVNQPFLWGFEQERREIESQWVYGLQWDIDVI